MINCGREEDLPLALVAPQALRRDVHVDNVRGIRTVVQRAVILHVLRATDLQAVPLQAHPEVGTEGVAFLALGLLKLEDNYSTGW